jgi:hypothetical protein
MTRRVIVALTAVLVSAVGLSLAAAAGPLSADWTMGITFDPNGTFLSDLESAVDLGYTTGPVVWASYSEFQLPVGFLWQAFGVKGQPEAFAIQGDVLFGPSTADFLYGQMIVEMRLAGVDLGLYYAQISDAVLGGPADGFAFRMAGSVGGFDVVSITEMGARIEDDDFDGIDIVHAATGLYRRYATDPVVPGQGFTGEKLTVSGWSFGCAESIEATAYVTCEGLDFASFEMEDIALGISWLALDLGITYEVQTKSVALTPRLVVGNEILCLEPYFGIQHEISPWEIGGIYLGGLALVSSWNGVTVKGLTIFDPGRYVITTEECGSGIEPLENAIGDGHEYYAKYWELLSIEIVGNGCCGGKNRLLVNTYFEKGSGGIFGWGMTCAEASVGLSAAIELWGSMTVIDDGLDGVGVGIALHW